MSRSAPIRAKMLGAVLLVVVVIAVLSYRYFAGTGDAAGARAGPRQSGTRGRQVTSAMVEAFPPPLSVFVELTLGHTCHVSKYPT